MNVRLTKLAKRAGCAAKAPPGALLPLLGGLPAPADPNVLVGSATADDAAVYRLDDERALVLTTDFFTPIVDDPYDFGAIAAANAMSDVWAMGGRPIAALNLVGFPDALEPDVLAAILKGGAEKAREAGIDVVGGHTIRSEEPIYGMAVTGLVHPARATTNAEGRPGDALVLTKPIGLGIITTAAKAELDDEGAIAEAIALMKTLNRAACEAMLSVGARCATDITGFGLLGHLRSLSAASGVSARVFHAAVPVLEAARRYVHREIAPGGTVSNWKFLSGWVDWGALPKPEQLLLSDAQTSGGLLVAIPKARAGELVAALRAAGTPAAAVVGELVEGPAGRIQVEAEVR